MLSHTASIWSDFKYSSFVYVSQANLHEQQLVIIYFVKAIKGQDTKAYSAQGQQLIGLHWNCVTITWVVLNAFRLPQYLVIYLLFFNYYITNTVLYLTLTSVAITNVDCNLFRADVRDYPEPSSTRLKRGEIWSAPNWMQCRDASAYKKVLCLLRTTHRPWACRKTGITILVINY